MDQLETGGVPPDPAPMQARPSRSQDAVPRPTGTPDRIEVRPDARLDGADARPRSLERGPVSAGTKPDASAGMEERLRRVEWGLDGLDGTTDPFVGRVAGDPPRRWPVPAAGRATVVSLPVSYPGVPSPRAHVRL